MYNKEISKEDLHQLLALSSGRTIDSNIFEQLYQRTVNQYKFCTVQNFERSYADAIQILQQKIIKTKDLLIEEKDNLQALNQKQQINYTSNSQQEYPIKLRIINAQILNLQVKNNFLIGYFAFFIKIGDYFNFVSEMKPSYNMIYSITKEAIVPEIGDSLLISMMSDFNTNVQNSKIVIPLYTLQFGQVVNEILSYKTQDELFEVDLQYEVTIENSIILSRQIRNEIQICQNYITKYEDELADYELQVQDLRSMNVQGIGNQDVINNELTQGYNQKLDQSSNTYGIGVPDYYKRPLELQSDAIKTQERLFIYDSLIYLFIALIFASTIGIVLNSILDCSVILLITMIYLSEKKFNSTMGILLTLSILYDCLFFYLEYFVKTYPRLNNVDQNNKYAYFALLLSAGFQLFKLFLIFRCC